MNKKDMTKEQVIIGLSDALRVEINRSNKPDDRVYALNYRQAMESELLRRLVEADALRKENEELRKDKERLDWMDKLEPNAFYMLSLFRHADGSILVIADGSKPIREHLDNASKAKESEASHE